MSDFTIIVANWGNDILRFLKDLTLYTGLGTLEFWENMRVYAAASFFLNVVAIVLVMIMRGKNICPKILNEFPYWIIFPKSVRSGFLWIVSYDLAFIELPKAMISFLSN